MSGPPWEREANLNWGFPLKWRINTINLFCDITQVSRLPMQNIPRRTKFWRKQIIKIGKKKKKKKSKQMAPFSRLKSRARKRDWTLSKPDVPQGHRSLGNLSLSRMSGKRDRVWLWWHGEEFLNSEVISNIMSLMSRPSSYPLPPQRWGGRNAVWVRQRGSPGLWIFRYLDLGLRS